MENPAFSDGAPKSDQKLGSISISSDHSPSLQYLQAVKITKRCAVSIAMAATLAPILFGEHQQ
ncbi:hypothetical protein V5279_28985 [Bradyrhizobium sp. 26S5]|uniref:hypothetical protein n=1 Tax=Bradyrhizobium sp. 26S5 TaxID=3139729 RepID=UPI0030CCD03B